MGAFLKECLRMWGPANSLFDRVALYDHKIKDLNIKKGTLLTTSLLALSFNPKFHADPEEFRPERFLDDDSLTKKSISETSYAYIPFSAGPRNCIGQNMA